MRNCCRCPIITVYLPCPVYLIPCADSTDGSCTTFLFESASQTLLEFGDNPKRLGAKIGFDSILHTWGGRLWLHPHIHFIVTAGGVNAQGLWMEPNYSSTFLFPVKALSNVFRAKFLHGLIAAHGKDLLKLPGELAQYSRPCAFKQWLFHTVTKHWGVISNRRFQARLRWSNISAGIPIQPPSATIGLSQWKTIP